MNDNPIATLFAAILLFIILVASSTLIMTILPPLGVSIAAHVGIQALILIAIELLTKSARWRHGR